MKKRSKIKAAARACRRAAPAISRVMVTIPGGMHDAALEKLMQNIERWRAKGGTLPIPNVPGLRVAAWDEKGNEIRIDCMSAGLRDVQTEIRALHAMIDDRLSIVVGLIARMLRG